MEGANEKEETKSMLTASSREGKNQFLTKPRLQPGSRAFILFTQPNYHLPLGMTPNQFQVKLHLDSQGSNRSRGRKMHLIFLDCISFMPLEFSYDLDTFGGLSLTCIEPAVKQLLT